MSATGGRIAFGEEGDVGDRGGHLCGGGGGGLDGAYGFLFTGSSVCVWEVGRLLAISLDGAIAHRDG